ncbi:MAG TPA: Stp1/IreP family PP2C-type Ser/Thr phosphatase [Acidimicrobiales bacterium]|nr:Stp1/IreP family PP2C-type Ser/Thr phosphatase [Acidimicrobiales bacterium]
MTVLRSGAATDVGRVRESNEDRYLTRDDVGLFAVADGVGGHQAGEVASQMSVETLEEAFEEPTTEGLVTAVKEANQAVWHLAQSASEKRGMGTTLTAVALVQEDGEEHLAVANVGDSRAYLFQQGELTQLTEDHSLVEELYRDGQISREEAEVHPQRSIITRALGMEPEIEVDSWQLIPYRGDRILLCSDGLTNEVSDERIESTLRRISDPQEVAQELVRQARANGGNDNITVVVIDVVDDDDRAERSSAALAADPAPTAERWVDPTPPPRSLGSTEDAARAWGVEEPSGGALPTATATATRPPAVARPVDDRPPRRLTWRVIAFCVALGAILAVIVGAFAWYARSTYYVGVDGDRVAIFKGRPGGLLWFEPTLHERKPLTTADVLPARLPDLRAGHQVSSKADADRYVNEIRQEAARAAEASQPPPLPTSTIPGPETATTVG